MPYQTSETTVAMNTDEDPIIPPASDLELATAAIRRDDVKALQALIDRSPDLVSATMELGSNDETVRPLMLACIHSAYSCASVILNATGQHESDKPVWEQESPLFWAVSTGDVAMVKILLEHGVSPLQISANGRHSFHLAIEGQELDIAQALLDHGFPVDFPVKDSSSVLECQNTALHLACQTNNAETVLWLLDRGASLHRRNIEGKTPLEIAQASGMERVAAAINAWSAKRLIEDPVQSSDLKPLGS